MGGPAAGHEALSSSPDAPPGAPQPAWGPSPAGGAGIPPRRGVAGGALPSARFLPLPARPPPGRQPATCPRGRQEATCPRKECRARRAGGGRAPGRAGPARERPAAKVGERRRRASPRPSRSPTPPLRPAGAPRGPNRSVSHFPRRTRWWDDPRAPGAGVPGGPGVVGGGWGGAVRPNPGRPRPPPRGPPPTRPRRLGEGGRPARLPTPLPAAGGFGAPVGSRGLISRGAGVWPAGPRVVSHTRCSPSPGAERALSPS